MINLLILAMACGWGQQPMVDQYGNSTCVQAQTGEVRQIEGSLTDCPTGMMPRLTVQGPACVQKDTGQSYYDTRRVYPSGTARMIDQWGNWTYQ